MLKRSLLVPGQLLRSKVSKRSRPSDDVDAAPAVPASMPVAPYAQPTCVERREVDRGAAVSEAPKSMATSRPESPSAPDNVDLDTKIPSKVGSSISEVFLVSHLLNKFGKGGEDRLKDALNAGKSHYRTDALFRDILDLPTLWFEYDPGYTHTGKDRVEGDVRKTEKLLKNAPPDDIVVRLRVNAPSIDNYFPDEICKKRLLIVNVTTKEQNFSKLAEIVAKKIAEWGSNRLSDDMKKQLLKVNGKKDKSAEDTAHKLLMCIDDEYKHNVEELERLVGEKDALRILNCHGVKSRIDKFVHGYEMADQEWQFRHALMVRFVCNGGVPSRIDSPTFRAAVGALRTDPELKLNLSDTQLVKLVNNDVAPSRVENAAFRLSLVDIKNRHGLSNDQLVDLVGNECAAARVENVWFCDSLVDIKKRHGLSNDQLVDLVGNGCAAARVCFTTFRDALVDFKEELGRLELSTDQFVDIAGNDCAAKRLEDDEWRAAIVTIATPMTNRAALCPLLKNNGVLASRVNTAEATHMAAIVTHLNGLSLDGGVLLHTLLGKSIMMIDRVRLLRTKVESISDKLEMERFVKSCKGDNNKNRDAVALALCESSLTAIASDAFVDLKEKLGQLGLSTDQFVDIVGNDIATKCLKSDEYRAAIVTIATPMTNRAALCRLLKNNGGLASRVNTASAAHMAAIVTHLNGLSLDGGVLLHTLLGNCIMMIDRVHDLRSEVESISDKAEMERFVKSHKGDLKKRNAKALALCASSSTAIASDTSTSTGAGMAPTAGSSTVTADDTRTSLVCVTGSKCVGERLALFKFCLPPVDFPAWASSYEIKVTAS